VYFFVAQILARKVPSRSKSAIFSRQGRSAEMTSSFFPSSRTARSVHLSIIVSGETHLRRILISYADYYNTVRTHRALHKDAPIFRPIQQTGVIRSHPILGGLHHQYVRV
jgi:hypothetical protein